MTCKTCNGKGEVIVKSSYGIHLVSCPDCQKVNNKIGRSGKR